MLSKLVMLLLMPFAVRSRGWDVRAIFGANPMGI